MSYPFEGQPTISNRTCQGISMVPTLPEAGDRLFSPEAGSRMVNDIPEFA